MATVFANAMGQADLATVGAVHGIARLESVMGTTAVASAGS